MEAKKELIAFINTNHNGLLTTSNTSFSKINISKEVWWFNVRTHKFNSDVHLLLKAEDKVIWIHLPKGFVKNLGISFKIRPDKDAVDLEISADKQYKYLQDIKSGGTNFDFASYVQKTIKY